MKKIYLSALIVLYMAFNGCGSAGQGELIGIKGKPYKQELPLGMVYIPAGTFIMGQVDQDVTISQFPQNKQVTISAFYMDETEISEKYMLKPKGKTTVNPSDIYIDWKKVGTGKKGLWADKTLVADLEKSMYYQGNEKFFNKKELNVEQLRYSYAWIDYRKAADNRGARDPNLNKNGISVTRDNFIIKEEVYIYPDTLVWISDFSYAQNDPMVKGYFSHPAFLNYPVVGVSWKQAKAFSVWRSRFNEAYKVSVNLPARLDLANFKPGRGNYIDDGGATTVAVKSYFPNDYGLYNMAGNVAEWTSSIYNDVATAYVNTLNPSFDRAAITTKEELSKVALGKISVISCKTQQEHMNIQIL